MSNQLRNRSGSEREPQNETRDATERPNVGTKLDKSGLYDLQQVKRLLDDEVISFMESQGYEECTTVSNIKLVAGTIAVIAALYSHFGVGEFPGCRTSVLACVVTYICCSVLITLASVALEASAIYVGQLTQRARQVSKGNAVPRLWVHTTIGGKGLSAYRIEMRTSVRGKQNAVESSFPYETYFSSDGAFMKEQFCSDMTKVISGVVKGVSSSSKKMQ